MQQASRRVPSRVLISHDEIGLDLTGMAHDCLVSREIPFGVDRDFDAVRAGVLLASQSLIATRIRRIEPMFGSPVSTVLTDCWRGIVRSARPGSDSYLSVRENTYGRGGYQAVSNDLGLNGLQALCELRCGPSGARL